MKPVSRWIWAKYKLAKAMIKPYRSSTFKAYVFGIEAGLRLEDRSSQRKRRKPWEFV